MHRQTAGPATWKYECINDVFRAHAEAEVMGKQRFNGRKVILFRLVNDWDYDDWEYYRLVFIDKSGRPVIVFDTNYGDVATDLGLSRSGKSVGITVHYFDGERVQSERIWFDEAGNVRK